MSSIQYTNPLNPALAQYQTMPENVADITLATFIHAYHGTYVFWLPNEVFHTQIMSLIRPAWVNGFTIVINS